MNTRKYGKLGWDVSALGLGCMRLPRIYDGSEVAQVDREKAYELIRYAATHGINYFDTALTYHNRTSEEVLGEALDGGLREKVHVVTKQPFSVMKSKADIRRNLEATLKKLRTDYLDVYLIHNISDKDWPGIQQLDVISEYEKFKAEGLIRAIGFSYHGTYAGWKPIFDFYDWDMCQIQQNMIDVDKEVTEQAILRAGERGCALVIMEPLRGGGLANAPASVKAVYDRYPEHREPYEWAFKHLINYPQISTILSGMTTMEQLKANIELFSKPTSVPNSLSEAEKTIIREAKEAYDAIVTVPCTRCEYCMPCPQGVDIPGAFYRYNEGMMFGSFDQPKRSYMFSVRAGRSADHCIGCGACERKCPQHIPIIQSLKTAHEALKGWIE